MLHEQLDAPVLLEVQKHVLNKLENVWLPLFLASEQFAARQKIKVYHLVEYLHRNRQYLLKHHMCLPVDPAIELLWCSG